MLAYGVSSLVPGWKKSAPPPVNRNPFKEEISFSWSSSLSVYRIGAALAPLDSIHCDQRSAHQAKGTLLTQRVQSICTNACPLTLTYEAGKYVRPLCTPRSFGSARMPIIGLLPPELAIAMVIKAAAADSFNCILYSGC